MREVFPATPGRNCQRVGTILRTRYATGHVYAHVGPRDNGSSNFGDEPSRMLSPVSISRYRGQQREAQGEFRSEFSTISLVR